MTATPLIRVIVVNYNGGLHLAKCLDALRRQSMRDFEAVVVDNNSSDGSLDAALPTDDERFSALRFSENLGFAAGNNRGAEGTTTPWIVALNPDAFPEENWLATLLEEAAAHPEAEMIGSTQLLYLEGNEELRFDGAGDNLSIFGLAWRGGFKKPATRPFPAGECFAPCAAGALYRTAAFQAVGGFDERFFCYLEDVDLAFRIRLRGGRCYQSGKAVLWHVSSGLTGRHSFFSLYHGYRNSMWLALKCLPYPLLPLALVAQSLVCLAVAVRGLQSGTGRAGLLALKDGLGGAGPMLESRRRLSSEKTVPWSSIYRALSWNPIDLLKRRILLEPWS